MVLSAGPVKIHTDTASFLKIRNKPGSIYFDKTGFIQKLLEDQADATLFCRPRGFGKSHTLSMLECFHGIQFRNLYNTLFKSARLAGWISAHGGGKHYTGTTLRAPAHPSVVR
ncbi:hypothetical protein BDD12DRAFT_890538 [Trichophaea hybrida]|nr:hypothetical protein BDD12DRAFT_890538 [Trichophaea hybrida]